MRARLTIQLAVAALALGFTAAAGANPGAASVPTTKLPAAKPPDTRALAALGLRIKWPLGAATTTVRPGGRLSVSVVNARRGRRRTAVRLSLRRVDAAGRSLGAVATSRLYGGRRRFTVPKRAGAIYELTLTAARLSYRGWIATPVAGSAAPLPGSTTAMGSPATSTSTSTSTPTPTAPPSDGTCPTSPGDSDYAATLSVAQTSVTAGDSVGYTVTNTGSSCVSVGAEYDWQELVDGSWTDVQTNDVFPAYAVLLAPGKSFSGDAGTVIRSSPTTASQADTPFAPGQYRLVVPVGAGPGQTELTADVQVDAPAG